MKKGPALPDTDPSKILKFRVEPVGRKDAVTFVPSYLNNRAATIYDGSSEVQWGIVAKTVPAL